MKNASPTKPKTSTTDMQVTSIRFDRELIESLKQLAGSQGYQSLIREVLWDYVRQRTGESQVRIDRADIRATIAAVAESPQQCGLTGKLINPQESMQLALLNDGKLVAIAVPTATDSNVAITESRS